jgi:hypothetical protein
MTLEHNQIQQEPQIRSLDDSELELVAGAADAPKPMLVVVKICTTNNDGTRTCKRVDSVTVDTAK